MERPEINRQETEKNNTITWQFSSTIQSYFSLSCSVIDAIKLCQCADGIKISSAEFTVPQQFAFLPACHQTKFSLKIEKYRSSTNIILLISRRQQYSILLLKDTSGQLLNSNEYFHSNHIKNGRRFAFAQQIQKIYGVKRHAVSWASNDTQLQRGSNDKIP